MKNTTINIIGSDNIRTLTNLWLTPPAYTPIPLALLPEVENISAINKAATAITRVTRKATKKDFNAL
jgi:hypothetical protein